MGKPRFTPGPWELSLDVPNWGEGDDDPEFYSVYINKEAVDIATDRAKFDAHLIAAAPDLYAFARAFEDLWHRDPRKRPNMLDVKAMCRAALEKAEGE